MLRELVPAQDPDTFCRYGCYWDCEHRVRIEGRWGWPDPERPLQHVNARTWPVAEPARAPDIVDAARFAFPRRFVAPQLTEPLRSLVLRVNDSIAQYAQRQVAREMLQAKAKAVGYPRDIAREAQNLASFTTIGLDEAADRILWEWTKGVPVDEIAGRIARSLR